MTTHPTAGEIEALVARATKGPWRTDPEYRNQTVTNKRGYLIADCAIFVKGRVNENEINEANAALIALAPTLAAQVVDLASRLAAAEGESERLRWVLRWVRREYGATGKLSGETLLQMEKIASGDAALAPPQALTPDEGDGR